MRTHRRIAVAGLVAGPFLFAVGDLLRRLVVSATDASTTQVVAAVQQHPGLWLAAALSSVAGSALVLPGVLALTMRITGRRSWLTTLGGYLFAVGWVASVAHAVGFFGLSALYARTGIDPQVAHVLDEDADRYPLLAIAIGLFMVGVILGQLLWFTGLTVSRRVPVWAALAALVDVVAGGSGGVLAGGVGLVAWLVAFVPAARALDAAWVAAEDDPEASHHLQVDSGRAIHS